MPLQDPSSDEFRAICQRVTEIARAYLTGLDARPIFPNTNGAQTLKHFAAAASDHGVGMAVFDDLSLVIQHLRAQNGRFFGYVMGSNDPVAAASDLLISILNQNVTAWRSSPAAVTIEQVVVGWLASAIGCEGFSGSLTGGGSSANL